MSKRTAQHWYVHGQAYDLRPYSKVHPGGEFQIMGLQGRDCTEMVYSMHAMASIDKVKAVLEKYKVNEPKDDEPETFVWTDEGLYGILKKRVKNYIASLGSGESHKADNFFWLVVFLEFLVHVSLFYAWIGKGIYICALLAGLVTTSLGFMIFHTAGHNGISKNSKVNNFWYIFLADYVLGFMSKLWNVHHNYAHHCYTNIHRKDPDVSNALAVIRKSPYQTLKPQHKAQWYTAYLLLVFMPNQWFGQVLQYLMSTLRGKIFGAPLIHRGERSLKPFYIFGAEALILATIIFINQGFLYTLGSLYLYSFGVGFAYWGCVFPNHDTEMSEQSSIEDVIKKPSDWGEHQVRHSSNFWMPKFMTYFVGGMNYQIEHHLFPTVHPRHYPSISKIVSEECKKKDIPYHMHKSWFHALMGNFKHLYVMSKLKLE